MRKASSQSTGFKACFVHNQLVVVDAQTDKPVGTPISCTEPLAMAISNNGDYLAFITDEGDMIALCIRDPEHPDPVGVCALAEGTFTLEWEELPSVDGHFYPPRSLRLLVQNGAMEKFDQTKDGWR